VLVERKANGEAILNVLKGRIPGLMGVDPLGGKIARANATTPLWMAGNVWLPDRKQAPWVDGFVKEHLTFPVGKNDDCVDAASQYLAFASGHTGRARIRAAAQGMRQQMVTRVW